MTQSHILNGLNDSQKMAVTTTEGPVLVVAGPGTGKTLTIIRRIAYLINQGVAPENILAVTFTNRAAKEMLERAKVILDRSCDRIFIGTFHLLGLKIIRHTLPDDFIIFSRDEQLNLLKTLLKKSGSKAQQVAEKISRFKNFIEEADDETEDIYERYQSALKENSALDFDDLILGPVQLLGKSDQLERYGAQSRYIIVDEYQDINPAQYKLLRLLTGSSRNICAVGDSDQAIYAFRGADMGNFLNFEKDYEGAERIFLTDNYRSTGTILNTSNSLIKNNLKRIDKEVSAVREKGSLVTIISVPDEKAEGEAIVREIEQRIGGTSHYQMMHNSPDRDFPNDSYCFSDFAVIFRTNAQAKAIEDIFIKAGIPYQIIGRANPVKSNEISDTLSYLKAIINPEHDLSLRRVLALPSIGIGNSDLSEISGYAEENGLSLYDALKAIAQQGDKNINGFLSTMENLLALKNDLPADEFLAKIIEKSGLKSYYKNSEDSLELLKNLAAAYRDLDPAAAIVRVADEALLMTPADCFDPRAEVVTLMTLHMAKGLEFKVVFIAGVEEGLIPYTLRKDSIDIEEERRLFYVGMTRARDELFLINARKRFLYGERLTPLPSSFLKEITEEFTNSIVIPDRARKQKENNQMGLF